MTETLQPILPPHIERAAHELLRSACDKDIALTTAESCTGGLLAALLTDVEGCSHIFDRGFVVYSEQAKCDLLGIARDMVDRCGAVSREVAEAMARGALERTDGGVALAITGFAGPTEEGEEGLVHFACQRTGGRISHREEHFGAIGRDGVRIGALDVALAMMKEALDQ